MRGEFNSDAVKPLGGKVSRSLIIATPQLNVKAALDENGNGNGKLWQRGQPLGNISGVFFSKPLVFSFCFTDNALFISLEPKRAYGKHDTTDSVLASHLATPGLILSSGASGI